MLRPLLQLVGRELVAEVNTSCLAQVTLAVILLPQHTSKILIKKPQSLNARGKILGSDCFIELRGADSFLG